MLVREPRYKFYDCRVCRTHIARRPVSPADDEQNLRVPSGAALDCVVGGCRWGTPSMDRCECVTLTGDRRVCGFDIGEGDECFLDAGHEGAHS